MSNFIDQYCSLIFFIFLSFSYLSYFHQKTATCTRPKKYQKSSESSGGLIRTNLASTRIKVEKREFVSQVMKVTSAINFQQKI